MISSTEAGNGIRAVFRDHIVYLSVVLLYGLPFLFNRDLLYRDESRYGAVIKEMGRNDTWFTLTLDGAFYPDKPPLFFGLIRLATEIADTTAPWVFFLVIMFTAFFFVAASDAFLRAAGTDRRTVLSANLILLGVPWIAVHMQILRMDLLFSGLILFSLACYVRGIDRPNANLLPPVGGVLAALAVLTKGPFGALIPLLSIAVYLAVTRRSRLMLRADLLWSIGLVALPILVWLAAIYASLGYQALETIFGQELAQRALSGRDSSRPLWLYPLWLGLTLMPWLLLLPAFMDKKIRGIVFNGSSGDVEIPDVRLILSTLAVSMALLGLVAQKHIHYLLPLVPALMVMIAIAYTRLDANAPRLIDWFYVGLAVAALIGPTAGVWALGLTSPRTQADVTNYVRPETLTHIAAALSLTAIPLAVAARLRGQARLVAGVASVAIMVIAIKAIVLPDLDRIYSPRHMVAAFERHVPEDQPILVYGIYRGSLSYHFNRPLVLEERTADLADLLRQPNAPAFAIVPRSRWERSQSKLADFRLIDEVRLETKQIVLVGPSDQG